MSFTTPASKTADAEPMMDMNMTPLIDVMLVLIIMLIITIPRQNHAINLTLPNHSQHDKPETFTVDIDFDGTVLWNGTQVASRAELERRLTAVGAAALPGAVMLRPNKLVAYKAVAGVMAMAQRARVHNLGVIGNAQIM